MPKLTAARTQAGMDKIKLKSTVLGSKDRPAHQVDQVREAVARNPLALIVELVDVTDFHMAEIFQEARQSGIPVVLLYRPLAPSASSTAATKSTGKTAKPPNR